MRGVLKPKLSSSHSPGLVLGLALLALSTACSRSSNSPTLAQLNETKVEADANADRTFDTDEGQLRVVGRAEFERMLRDGRARGLAHGNRPEVNDENQLLVGLPKASLGKEHYFGAVITATDDKNNEEFGGLKLTDMTPIHVYPRQTINAQANTSTLILEGCVQNCKPNFTDRTPVAEFPVSGEDADRLYIDFSIIGSDMNLVEMLDPNGEFLHLKGVSASTVSVSYSHDTLLFDVLGKMEEMPASAELLANLLIPQGLRAATPDEPKKIEFTTRWYLKKRVLNARFKPQVATEGVGYFMTERFQTAHTHKHADVDSAGNPIKTHYFIKNVPDEHKAAFKQAFEDWNDVFEAKIGARILTTEFVDSNDPLAKDLVTGDVRVKVIEWDLLNKAGYGGLGPSISDQETGSMISSNVLVQGPEIIKIYTEWFQVNREAAALRDMGEEGRADEVLRDARNRLFEEIQGNANAPKLVLALNNGAIKFNVNSQDPRMQDEVAATKLDFEVLPANISYEDYMQGYFRELVAHELGHNMGLRHNFRGNLFAGNDQTQVGKQSGSIMEYLSRPYRYLDRISAYDNMAIDYGYALKAPTSKIMFCTDEGVGNIAKHTGSAECSRDDAENDPYAQLQSRLVRTRDLFIGKGSVEAPVWTKADITPHFAKYGDGLLLYGESAQRSMNTWIRFFVPAGRPAKDVTAVKGYVAKTLAKVACEEGLEESIRAEKGNGEAARVALANLAEYRKMTKDRVREVLGSALADQVSCAQPAALELAAE